MSTIQASSTAFLYYYHIVLGQTVTVANRTQYNICDELQLDGEIIVIGILCID